MSQNPNMGSEFRKIIFSGVNGPLGYALKNLVSDDDRFMGFSSSQCDLRDKEVTKAFFEDQLRGFSPSNLAYIHLAAVSGGAKFSAENSATVFVDNMLMAVNATSTCCELGIKRVIMTLSTSCYSESEDLPIESQLHAGPVSATDFAYSYAKRMQEVLMRSFNQQYGMDISSVLVNGIIGGKMNFNPESRILPASLICEISKAKEENAPVSISFDPRVRREYTWSKDLAQAILWCLNFQERNSLFNIGNSRPVSIPELVSLIAKSVGLPSELLNLVEVTATGRLVQKTVNESFLRVSDVQYSPLIDAVSEAVFWYLENLGKVTPSETLQNHRI
jgi:nucleoside-diphosphate-sugar epimerase